MDIRILLLDDNELWQDDLGHKIREFGLSSSERREQPWQIQLGTENVLISCILVSEPDEASNVLRSPSSELDNYDLILIDNGWDEKGSSFRLGLDLLKDMDIQRGQGPLVAIYTAASSYEPDFVREALTLGADALISKREPIHLLNLLVSSVERKKARLAIAQLDKLTGIFEEGGFEFSTSSEKMKACLRDAALLAPWRNEPILILGGVGTGKSRLAHAIHERSPRANGNFIVLDPSHISQNLIQSELFGVEKGAFTGAIPRKGLLEVADKGTLFVDDLQNMSVEMQQIMLSVFLGEPFRSVGGTQEKKVDVRFIFASNVDLDDLVRDGKLRKDLHSRIQLHKLRLPLLSERREDIRYLAVQFMAEFYRENLPDKSPAVLLDSAMGRLESVDWQYNVRSLRNAIRRTAALLPPGQPVSAENLVLDESPGEFLPVTANDAKRLFELAPRTGSQRTVFDLLLKHLGESISYQELHRAIGYEHDEKSTVSPNLMTIVSRLRTRLSTYGYDIRQDKSGSGYVLVKAI